MPRMTRRAALASLAGLGVLMVAGCASGSGGAGARSAGSSGGSSSGSKPAAAEAWAPTKPVTITVPYAAGGSTDLCARSVEKVWSKHCQQPLIIVTKSGAGGFEGRDFVARGAADGSNLLFGYGSGEDLVTPQLRQVPVDPFKDFRAVARLSVHSVAVAVPGDSQFKSLKDIVDWAKQEKQPVTAAVSTAAGSVDLVMRGIGKSAGIEVTPVPHAGGSQAVTTLLGGQTTIGGGHPTEIIQHLRSGRLRAVAVATPERDPAVPDIPTLREQGVPFHTWGSVKGVAVPTKTPDTIVAYYEGLFKKIAEDPDFVKAMGELVQPVQYLNAKEYEAFMKQAYADYGQTIKELGIKIE